MKYNLLVFAFFDKKNNEAQKPAEVLCLFNP